MSPAELPEDLLSGYLDGELDAETRAAVEAHLAETPAWRDALDGVRVARDAVRDLPPVELSPEAWSRVIAAVEADRPAATESTPSLVTTLRERARRAPARWAGVGVAAAAAAAIIAVVFVPGQDRVTPKVATFSTEHSAQASLAGDPVSTLAGASVMRGLGR